ncbi:hypothetical protein CU098_006915 [Rhizopus stolonifer]|uniref:Uncharacterized protein n=1 Tax=Rhizopus stolonifer TaxID=4846 RepID=A0A367J4Y6_RHIST|nr:hypothetical protein CU098_006915 [Rhizopus stolonifer]
MKFSTVALLLAAVAGIQAAAITNPECKALGDKCIHKACGTKSGTGYKGYCCLTDDDCIRSCVNNQCTGIKNPKFSNPIPDSCKNDSTDYFGSNVKSGPAGVCCDSDEDCQNKCVKDHCTASS